MAVFRVEKNRNYTVIYKDNMNTIVGKQIQEWLGHSDFAVTANTYAHLEFDSKLASASAMTWIGDTSLAKCQDMEGVVSPMVSTVCDV